MASRATASACSHHLAGGANRHAASEEHHRAHHHTCTSCALSRTDPGLRRLRLTRCRPSAHRRRPDRHPHLDRKSTRLNSSHVSISYAVFCLTKKNTLV